MRSACLTAVYNGELQAAISDRLLVTTNKLQKLWAQRVSSLVPDWYKALLETSSLENLMKEARNRGIGLPPK